MTHEKIIIPIDKRVFDLGIGDIINKFSALRVGLPEEIIFLFPFSFQVGKSRRIKNLISDVLKNKGKVKFKHGFAYQKGYSDRLENAEINPKLETDFLFSEFELEWAKSIIERVGIEKDKNILAVCNNIPGKTLDKMWSEENWFAFISAILDEIPNIQIVFLPNFRKLDDISDDRIANRILEKYLDCKIFIFQSWLKNNIDKIVFVQKEFGISKNRQGLTIRQFSALIRQLILDKKCIGVFNDSAPVHAASAALGRDAKDGQIVSVNILDVAHHAPRNNAAAFSFSDKEKRIQTDPKLVSDYVKKFFGK